MRLRFPPRPARCDRPSVLHRHRPARLPHHHALRRASFSPARFSACCTKRATASTSRACGPSCYGLPPGEAVSLGIHESQSRMWENLVGRSRAFWEHFYPRGASSVSRGTGRRVARRFLLRHQRRAAVADPRRSRRSDLQPAHPRSASNWSRRWSTTICTSPICRPPGTKNIASTWASRRPTTPTACCKTFTGAAGLVGYFPTYSLGNLYAAQFFEQADRDLGGLDAAIRRRRIPAAARLAAREHPPPRPVLHGRRIGRARHRQTAVASRR